MEIEGSVSSPVTQFSSRVTETNNLERVMKTLKSQLVVLLLCIVCGVTGAYAQLTPSADAYTSTATPTTNFGAKTLLDVESASQTSYIQFDLSAIPAG
jgi:hypothetical protein